jgi:hypothetical protein
MLFTLVTVDNRKYSLQAVNGIFFLRGCAIDLPLAWVVVCARESAVHGQPPTLDESN